MLRSGSAEAAGSGPPYFCSGLRGSGILDRRAIWGFSLLEILVSLGLLAMILILAAGLFPSSVKAVKGAGMYNSASGLAKNLIEEGASAGPPPQLGADFFREEPFTEQLNGVRVVARRTYFNADKDWESGAPRLFDVVAEVWWDPAFGELDLNRWQAAAGEMRKLSYSIRVYRRDEP